MAKDVMKMRRERHAVTLQMHRMLDAAGSRSDKKLTPDEETRYAELETQVRSMTDEIALEERRQGIESLNAISSGAAATVEIDIPKEKRFSTLFPGSIGVRSGFETVGEFYESVFSGRGDTRLEKRVALASGGPLGGYAVPEQFGNIVWDFSVGKSIVLPYANLWPMTMQKMTVPAFSSIDRSADLYGFVGQWLGEGDTMTDQDPKLRATSLEFRKLGVFTSISRELMLFGNRFGEALNQALAEVVAWYSDRAYIRGSGVGQPLGVLNSAGTISVNRTAAGQIAYSDCVDMFARFAGGSGRWLASQSTVSQLLKMTDVAGAYILKNIKDGLLGMPIDITEHANQLGSRGDLMLVNFSSYSIGRYRDLVIEATNAFKFQNDLTSVRAIVLTDGQPAFLEPIKDANGNVVSPFVCLK